MSLLSKFLAAKEPLFNHTIDQLEKRTGGWGIDAQLTAEIRQKAADRLARLGLSDTDSPQAVYQALIGRIKQDDERLCRIVGGNDPTDLADLVPKIVDTLEQQTLPRSGWFIKASVAKQMLVDSPPKGIMKLLGYKTAKSLVAKEDITKLFCALRFCEDPDWLNKFNAKYAKKLQPNNFENRDIKIVIFEPERWGDVAAPFVKKKLHNITHSKEMGAICILPVGNVHTPGVAIKIMPLIAHYFNEIRMYSAFFKLVKARPDFGLVVAETLIADTPTVKTSAGGEIGWRVIQRYFGKLKHENHPEIFEPHLQPEDIHWRKAEEVLYDVDPELEFWRDLDFVGVMYGDEIVTFNMMDVALSYANQLQYEERYIYHFREALWNEIFARYFGDKTLEEQVIENLNNQIVKPSELA